MEQNLITFMNIELQKKIIDKYPKIFENASKSKEESCMFWGLECGNGWYEVISTLCEAATYTYLTSISIDAEDAKHLKIEKNKYNDAYDFNVKAPQMVADQVKEKFGTLRFYFHLEFDADFVYLLEQQKYPELEKEKDRYINYFDGIIHMAEVLSSKTCEVTGKPGCMHVRGGWLKVLNEEVANEEPYKQYKPYNQNKLLL